MVVRIGRSLPYEPIRRTTEPLGHLNQYLTGGDGVGAALSPTASQCAKLVMLKSQEDEGASMKEVSIIGVDPAKNVL